MQDLGVREVGAMFWADRDRLVEIEAMGVRCGQLGVPGHLELTAELASSWRSELERAQFTLVTVFAAYEGESYADIPTVERTVGFIPQATRGLRERRTCEVSDFAAAIGVKSVACHAGFIPEDKNDPEYIAVRDLVRRICDHAARNGQTFALETGQEPAAVLLSFLRDLGRPNAGINFDPANMILYGTGDPIQALSLLGPHVISVHCKDGDWPPQNVPGALGKERPLGLGGVGMERFLAKLEEIGFQGPLNVEREAENQEERIADMASGVELLKRLTAKEVKWSG